MKKPDTNGNNDQAYMRVLRELRKLIATEYKDGGRFPSSRVMCQRMNVNRLTYSKALACLFADGSALNYHQKGVYIVPDRLRCHKIGLILGRGEDCPFVGKTSALIIEAIQELEAAGYEIQLIQASPLDNLLRKSIYHGVSGLIWFYGQPMTCFSVAEDIHKNGSMPLVLARFYDPINNSQLPTGDVPHVGMDLRELGRRRADYFIDQKCEKVAYVGSLWYAQHIGFADRLNQAGIAMNDGTCIQSKDDIATLLPNMILKENITAIFSEGGTANIENVLKVLSNLPPGHPQPELVVRHIVSLAPLLASYPEVKVSGVESCTSAVGITAAKMMAKHLQNGDDLTSVAVPVDYSIAPPQ